MTVSRVVFVYCDDTAVDQLDAQMPYLHSEPHGHWVTFPNAVTDTPLCGPSRGHVITGRRQWETGVWDHGEMPASLEPHYGSTMFDSLHAAGVYTGAIGKWINNWLTASPFPPGIDYGFLRNSGGSSPDGYNDVAVKRETGGAFTATGYFTDVLAVEAAAFIAEAETTTQPWFLYVAVGASHGPNTPAVRHADTAIPLKVPAAWGQVATAGRPAALPATCASQTSLATVNDQLLAKARCMLAVDELIEGVVDDLDGRGILDETVIIFANDQSVYGGHYGSKALYKRIPHRQVSDPSLRIRWPGVTPRQERRLVGHLDLTATIMAVLDATPLAEPHGYDLTALVTTGTDPAWRKSVAMSHRYPPVEAGITPGTWFAVRHNKWSYTEWYGQEGTLANLNDATLTERTLYDLNADPYELYNVVNLETTVAGQLKQLLAEHKADPTFGGGLEDL